MKKVFFTLLGVSLLVVPNCFAQVSIGSSTAPHASAVLELTSSTKGFLLPRMTTAQRNAISTPAAGLMIYNTSLKLMETYTGGSWINDTSIGLTDVYNPTTGKIWMDRNLGATQVATSSTDAAAYGDLYQWGRGADGHQISTSSTSATQSSTDTPGALFITYYDWRNPSNINLWQGVNGTNNPCPSGYRLPTESEWNTELLSWTTSNAAGAFGSKLKLPVAGKRQYSGTLSDQNSYGYYWSSTAVGGSNSRFLEILGTFSVSMQGDFRGNGFSVRCIKD